MKTQSLEYEVFFRIIPATYITSMQEKHETLVANNTTSTHELGPIHSFETSCVYMTEIIIPN
jgi:hypothetical protein